MTQRLQPLAPRHAARLRAPSRRSPSRRSPLRRTATLLALLLAAAWPLRQPLAAPSVPPSDSPSAPTSDPAPDSASETPSGKPPPSGLPAGRAHRPASAGPIVKPPSAQTKTDNPTHRVGEGDGERALWLDRSRVVEFPPAGEAGSPRLREARGAEATEATPANKPDVETAAKSSAGVDAVRRVSPVFLDANGSPRALPGGVIVTLKTPLDEARARDVLRAEGLTPVRPVGGRLWLVESPTGLASLEFARKLQEGGRFDGVEPNWWSPPTLK